MLKTPIAQGTETSGSMVFVDHPIFLDQCGLDSVKNPVSIYDRGKHPASTFGHNMCAHESLHKTIAQPQFPSLPPTHKEKQKEFGPD